MPYTRINSRWIKDLNINHDTIKVLEENISSKILDIPCSNIFADVSPRAREIKGKKKKEMGLQDSGGAVWRHVSGRGSAPTTGNEFSRFANTPVTSKLSYSHQKETKSCFFCLECSLSSFLHGWPSPVIQVSAVPRADQFC